MDKYIKLMLVKLNWKYYKAIIINTQSYNKEEDKLYNMYKLIIKENKDKNKTIQCNNKRQLIQEMVKWLE